MAVLKKVILKSKNYLAILWTAVTMAPLLLGIIIRRRLSKRIAPILNPFYETYARILIDQIKKRPIPTHIGIIPDGNRRYAIHLGMMPWEGHSYGAKKVEEVLDWCLELDIKILTIYLFSKENFNRSIPEVRELIRLFMNFFLRFVTDGRVHKNKIRVRMIGEAELLPEEIWKAIGKVELLPEDIRHVIEQVDLLPEKVRFAISDLLQVEVLTDLLPEKIWKAIGEVEISPEDIRHAIEQVDLLPEKVRFAIADLSQVELLPEEIWKAFVKVDLSLEDIGQAIRRGELSRIDFLPEKLSQMVSQLELMPETIVKMITRLDLLPEEVRQPITESLSTGFLPDNIWQAIEQLDLFPEDLRQAIRRGELSRFESLPEKLSQLIKQVNLSPEVVTQAVRAIETATEGYDDFLLNVALFYTGRQEIVDACGKIVKKVQKGDLKPDNIDEDVIQQHLYTAGLPDPDLIIRTSGEERLSGFLLWQSAYSELYFCDAYWPSLRKTRFLKAIRSYQMRKRRFGL